VRPADAISALLRTEIEAAKGERDIRRLERESMALYLYGVQYLPLWQLRIAISCLNGCGLVITRQSIDDYWKIVSKELEHGC
jgi:hypothetical protein